MVSGENVFDQSLPSQSERPKYTDLVSTRMLRLAYLRGRLEVHIWGEVRGFLIGSPLNWCDAEVVHMLDGDTVDMVSTPGETHKRLPEEQACVLNIQHLAPQHAILSLLIAHKKTNKAIYLAPSQSVLFNKKRELNKRTAH